MDISNIIHESPLRRICSQTLSIDKACASEEAFLSVDPSKLSVEVARDVAASMVIVHTTATTSAIEIAVSEGASLSVTEIFMAEAFVEMHISQTADSRCSVVAGQFSSANLRCAIDLAGKDAECSFDGVFLASGNEHCVVDLRVGHNSADCRSRSVVKGVASGEALGEFVGLVYVAPDAQRTDARQQSRNIELSDTCRIKVRPQLEIYADDVKCSHGATVGRMDADAVFYMRQRGLNEMQARRLQIEGFVDDVVARCDVEQVRDVLFSAVAEKLEQM